MLATIVINVSGITVNLFKLSKMMGGGVVGMKPNVRLCTPVPPHASLAPSTSGPTLSPPVVWFQVQGHSTSSPSPLPWARPHCSTLPRRSCSCFGAGSAPHTLAPATSAIPPPRLSPCSGARPLSAPPSHHVGPGSVPHLQLWVQAHSPLQPLLCPCHCRPVPWALWWPWAQAWQQPQTQQRL